MPETLFLGSLSLSRTLGGTWERWGMDGREKGTDCLALTLRTRIKPDVSFSVSILLMVDGVAVCTATMMAPNLHGAYLDSCLFVSDHVGWEERAVLEAAEAACGVHGQTGREIWDRDREEHGTGAGAWGRG